MRKAAASKDKIERQALKLIEDKKIRRNNSKQWTVKSESSKGTKYRVRITESGLKCDCPYHQERNSACKHTMAVEMLILKEAEAADPLDTLTKLSGIDPSKCFKCKEQCRKDGWKYHERREPSQIFWCKKCEKRQTGTPGFVGRHISARVIVFAIMLFAMGMAPSGIVNILRDHEKIKVDISTVRRWVNYYVPLVEQYTKGLGPAGGPKVERK